MNNFEILQEWKRTPTKDKVLSKGLKLINNNNIDRYFGKNIEFGTAGIRGILGPGTNMVNEFTISAAAYAYGVTLIKENPRIKNMGIVIAHDNRKNGKLFTEVTARVFNHLGIKAYVFKNNEMAATPLLSYAIRKLKAAGGVNITASHNPKEYNGFKVYNSQGAQLLPKTTAKISDLMSKMNFVRVPYGTYSPIFIAPSLKEDYIEDIINMRKRPNDVKKLVVVYSALNGTGSNVAPFIFQKMDIEYYTVQKEVFEDENFRGLKSCNPEEESAYKRSIALAKKKDADIIVITDPDADRVGLAFKGPRGKYIKINGNQTAAIVFNHILKTKNYASRGYIAQSVVSSNLTKAMAKRNKIKVYETHVGFKNIAEIIRKNPSKLIMGYEESYGQLIDHKIARDKDAFQGMALLVEAANYLKTQNQSLVDELEKLGIMYGVHTSTQVSKQIDIKDVPELLKRISQIDSISNLKVSEIQDYTKGQINDLEKTNLVKVNFENGSWLAVRPSGTEPKVKFYIESVGTTKKISKKIVKQIINKINKIVLELWLSKKNSLATLLKYKFAKLLDSKEMELEIESDDEDVKKVQTIEIQVEESIINNPPKVIIEDIETIKEETPVEPEPVREEKIEELIQAFPEPTVQEELEEFPVEIIGEDSEDEIEEETFEETEELTIEEEQDEIEEETFEETEELTFEEEQDEIEEETFEETEELTFEEEQDEIEEETFEEPEPTEDETEEAIEEEEDLEPWKVGKAPIKEVTIEETKTIPVHSDESIQELLDQQVQEEPKKQPVEEETQEFDLDYYINYKVDLDEPEELEQPEFDDSDKPPSDLIITEMDLDETSITSLPDEQSVQDFIKQQESQLGLDKTQEVVNRKETFVLADDDEE